MSTSQIPSTKRRRAAAAPADGAKEATAGRRRGLATLPTNTQPGEDKENALGGGRNAGKKGGKAAGGGFGFGSRPVTKARKRPDKAASATRSRSTMEQARLDKELASAKEQIADFEGREAAADAELGAAKAELQVARDAIAAMKEEKEQAEAAHQEALDGLSGEHAQMSRKLEDLGFNSVTLKPFSADGEAGAGAGEAEKEGEAGGIGEHVSQLAAAEQQDIENSVLGAAAMLQEKAELFDQYISKLKSNMEGMSLDGQ